MSLHDLFASLLLFAYYIVACLVLPLVLKATRWIPLEVVRKTQHIGFCMSIFPLLLLFDTWHAAVLGMSLLALVAYPVLGLLEKASWYGRVFSMDRERGGGELRKSMIVIQLTYAVLLYVFWGLLDGRGKPVIAAAVTAWGFGDAAAAIVGTRYGRRRVAHRLVDAAKTWEGSIAMGVCAGIALFLTLALYGRIDWRTSLLIALALAPACSAIELLSRNGSDTVTVPLVTAFLLLPILQWVDRVV